MGNMPEQDLWRPFRFLLGTWSGTGTGKVGESRVERQCDLVLNGQFIRVMDRAIYEPQELNPKGEVHENIGYISYDRQRERYVLREFHVEGYVNQYVLEPWDPGAKRFVFVTEAAENIPQGLEARTTYQVLGPDRFREIFELRKPDGEWACFITTELSRVSGNSRR